MSPTEFKCRVCGTSKWPIEEPCYDLEVARLTSKDCWVSGWRMECLGRKENGWACYSVSPYFVDVDAARRYGTAYLEGKFVE
jgi:hypothetical protein